MKNGKKVIMSIFAKCLITLLPMLGIVGYMSYRSWHMTRAESFSDPISWLGVVAIMTLYGFMRWWTR